MCNKPILIALTIVGVLTLIASGLGVLIWWLVDGRYVTGVTILEGEGFKNVSHTAAFTNIRQQGDVFWLFYPTLSSQATNRPILLWLDGVAGLPPSLLANFGMFGPVDIKLNRREDSWIDEYNLLFVDSPIGTGFSKVQRNSGIPNTMEQNTDHLMIVLQTFYDIHENYTATPLYIFGQGHGAQMALDLSIRLTNSSIDRDFSHNLKGVVLGNGIISPSLALTKLGFYLEEMGYIDAPGRDVIEDFFRRSTSLVQQSNFEEAFDHFLTLEQFVNEEAGAVAVNLWHLVQKLTSDNFSNDTDYFGQIKYLQDKLGVDQDLKNFMDVIVASALGISNPNFDGNREGTTRALRRSFMVPAVDKVEHILNYTDLVVSIYNGNLDAVSNTPGQLLWVDSLQWPGRDNFTSAPRQTLVVDGLVEGYFRETVTLKFYWMNAAGQSPKDVRYSTKASPKDFHKDRSCAARIQRLLPVILPVTSTNEMAT